MHLNSVVKDGKVLESYLVKDMHSLMMSVLAFVKKWDIPKSASIIISCKVARSGDQVSMYWEPQFLRVVIKNPD